MAKFINTSGTTFFLEEMIKSTKKQLIIVSPYLKTKTRIRQLIESLTIRNIPVDVVFGKNDLSDDEQLWLASLGNISVRFCENLHAKCYINETTAIITSMNLYDFSQVNNNEMGVLIDCIEDKSCYGDALQEVKRIIDISDELKSRIQNHTDASILSAAESIVTAKHPNLPPEEIYEKLTTAKLAECCNVKTSELTDYFIHKGYLELVNGKPFLTQKGKSKGAEFRTGKTGPYFLWPKVLLKKFQEKKSETKQ